MSVVFDFNASLNDVAPVSPMLFPVDVMRDEKSELLMGAICVFVFPFVLQLRSSFVRDEFDFKASLKALNSMSLIPCPICQCD